MAQPILDLRIFTGELSTYREFKYRIKLQGNSVYSLTASLKIIQSLTHIESRQAIVPKG
jgi:hypothetical protein